MLTLITVDVELSPLYHQRHPDDTAGNARGAYYGDRRGRWGLRDQLELLRSHELRAVFFVEALSPVVTGPGHLQDVCGLIREYGQEIQLHTHPEWFALNGRYGDRTPTPKWMSDLPEPEQIEAIQLGLANLAAAGVETVTAHRSGAFGANCGTLRACATTGLRFDSSYCASALGDPCALDPEPEQTRPRLLDQVWEIPVSCFRQVGGSARPLQVCAVSAAEMRQALTRMRRAGTPVATILSHSFELLTRDRERVQPLHVRRFRGLCRFLAEHRETFPTAGFAQLQPSAWQDETWHAPPVQVAGWLTALRYLGQAAGRVYE